MICPHCKATLLWSDDRGAHCDGCDELDSEKDLPTPPDDIGHFAAPAIYEYGLPSADQGAAVDVSSGPSLGSSRSVSVHRLSRLAREWQKAGEAQSDLASEAAKKEDTIKVLTHLTRSHTLDNCATELRLFIGEHARRADDIATGDTPPVDNDHVAPGCELFSAPNAGDVARAGNAAAPKQPNSL